MKVIVMGCGRIGGQIGANLWREGYDVTVLDSEAESFLNLPREMREQDGTTFEGDGTRDEGLVRAGIRDANVFVAVSSRDNRNALAAQKAKHTFGVSRVVCRIGDPARQEVYLQLGLNAVSPTKVISRLILEAVLP